MNLFETVKSAVTVKQAAEYYGCKVNRGDMICCPFHDDRHPSMKLNRDYFYCFGCGATGDVIDFVARLFGLSSYEAAKKLAYDFGIDPDKPPAAMALKKPYPLARAFRNDEIHCQRVLCDYLHLLERWKVEYAPQSPEDELDDRFVEACHMIEYEGVDNIILTSKYGKTKCATAKVIAGIITAVFTTTLVAAFNLLFAFVFYGTEGLDCSILFAPSDYVEAFIPFNITCWTLLKYQILLAFTCTLSVTGITLFLSAISKNQIVALVAAMAIFLFPVLLPITEANPLFRLVGLLPIYHGLAISLLSVEQMSNGMLYAIWAIPAALLFLGVGAGISRRV
ncbi:hypothetical protein I250019C1_04220 [Faecalibacterium sp. i25-0019-C1]